MSLNKRQFTRGLKFMEYKITDFKRIHDIRNGGELWNIDTVLCSKCGESETFEAKSGDTRAMDQMTISRNTWMTSHEISCACK